MSAETRTKVVINGRVAEVGEHLSFDEVVTLAFPDIGRGNPNIEWEVDWRYAEARPGEEHELHPGEVLETRRGMMIDVTYTDKS